MNGHPPLDTHRLSEHARANRTYWNEESDAYQERNGPMLKASSGLGWGVWQIPEAQLQVLGNVRDKDVLELGCGAAQWSIALSQLGARPVGLDISEQQLAHARRLMEEAGVDFPLLHASAEEVPLPDASFDIIFCDWGATSFCDPYLYMREVERLLRPAGIFAFSGSTTAFGTKGRMSPPIEAICRTNVAVMVRTDGLAGRKTVCRSGAIVSFMPAICIS